MLKACLNGPRRPAEHPALPVTPAALAGEAAAAVAAGAAALHVHPKDDQGADVLDPSTVAAVLDAVRAAAPGVPVGVTTGAWAAPDPASRVAAVHGWTVLPDFASVNWHEPGATQVAEALLDRGIGVEAGLWQPDAVAAWHAWPHRDRCVRVLLEVVDDLAPSKAVEAATGLVEALGEVAVPVLLHGEGTSCWPVFREAVRRGMDVRIGLEDTLTLPDGGAAAGNADLVAAARTLLAVIPPDRTMPPLEADERATLASWLDFYRATLAQKCEGLTDDQLRTASTAPSPITLQGLVQHAAEVERNWFRRVLTQEDAPPIFDPDADPEGIDGGWDLAEGATYADVRPIWQAEIDQARKNCATRDLDDTSPFMGGRVTLRWIYTHMIAEYARHCGHADLIRERLDGTTGT